VRRLAWIAAAAVVAVVAPSQAWAHAALLRTTPTAGAVLERAPRTVTLRFTEPVDTALAEVRVLDAQLEPVRTGSLPRPRPDEIAVRLPALTRGTYVVAWRVVSEDTHPIHGSFVF
jgi:copper transport protein